MAYIKLEIIIAEGFISSLVAYMDTIGIGGYTAINISRGKGSIHGEQIESSLSTSETSYIFCILPEAGSQAAFNALKPFVITRRGLLFLTPIIALAGIGS
jgi:hypothetical protein